MQALPQTGKSVAAVCYVSMFRYTVRATGIYHYSDLSQWKHKFLLKDKRPLEKKLAVAYDWYSNKRPARFQPVLYHYLRILQYVNLCKLSLTIQQVRVTPK